MRKLAIALCLTASVLTALGQGSINFNNRVTAVGINAPVDFAGALVTGPEYVGQLFVNNAGSFEAVGAPVEFRTGAAAGYINGGSVSVSFVAPGASADVIMRAWATASGADWDAASTNPNGIFGESNQISIATGGAGSPPSLPADLVGLNAFTLTQVPEPSTVALGLLGLAALALRRRK